MPRCGKTDFVFLAGSQCQPQRRLPTIIPVNADRCTRWRARELQIAVGFGQLDRRKLERFARTHRDVVAPTAITLQLQLDLVCTAADL